MLQRNARGQLRGPGPGRPKGSKNRFTLLRKEFLATYDELNPHTGREHLVEWARKNPTAFYRIIARQTRHVERSTQQHVARYDLRGRRYFNRLPK